MEEYMFICKHCKKEFKELSTANKANHSRWCTANPKRQLYVVRLKDARENIKNPRNQFVKAKDEGRLVASVLLGKPSTRKNYKHSQEVIEVIRTRALSSPHRRLVRSIRQYVKADGTIVMLDSSWEEALALRLDELGIQWERPKTPFKWMDNLGKEHNYFPDFYLNEYNIFLDPKNPHAVNTQKEKLDIIQVQLPNLKIITTLKECREFKI